MEGQADGVDGADATASSGFDDAAHIGVESGGPFAAKAVGDFAIDGARAQGPFRAVVGGCQPPIGDEDEQMRADCLEGLLQLAAGFVGGRQAQQTVEPSIEIGVVGFERAVGEPVAPTSDRAGALQQPLQPRSERRIALVDGPLRVADEVGEAKLLFLPGPAGLAAQAIGNPIVGPPFAQKAFHDRFGAVRVDDEDGGVAIVEHPQPPVGTDECFAFA